MRISIIGSGTVGYAVGKGFSKLGHDVVFCDVSRERVQFLKEKGEHAILENKLRDLTFITVPVPTKANGELNLCSLHNALKEVGEELKDRDDYPIVVVKSTVLPNVLVNDVIPFLEEHTKEEIGETFGFCYNPEFLRERCAHEDFMNPDRIVLGEYDRKAIETLKTLYRPFDAPIYTVGLKEAATIKYVANNFLSTKISFFNEMYMIAKKQEINPDIVAKIVSKDRRISDYGIIGGQEFGGRCLPKDLRSFLHFCKQENNPSLLKAVKQVNEKIKESEHRREIEVD